MEWLLSNIEKILMTVASVIAAASAIAALTPTKADDKIIMKIKKVVDLLALNVGNAKPAPKASSVDAGKEAAATGPNGEYLPTGPQSTQGVTGPSGS